MEQKKVQGFVTARLARAFSAAAALDGKQMGEALAVAVLAYVRRVELENGIEGGLMERE